MKFRDNRLINQNEKENIEQFYRVATMKIQNNFVYFK